jgi:hypothetical protein
MEELLTDEASNRHKSSVALFLKIKKGRYGLLHLLQKG